MALRFSSPIARERRAWLCIVLGAAAAAACGLNAHYQKLANGDLRVTCRGPLLTCLEPAADACDEYGYDVLSADERHETTGSSPEQETFVRSEATVRCRRATPLFGHDPNQPAASAAPSPSAGPPRCVPGSSQACATPTCTGAQICTADGTRFAPCECAPGAQPSGAATSGAAPGGAAPSASSVAAPGVM